MTYFTKNTTAIFYNEHPKPIQRMLDFDYLCKRDIPSVAAIVNPTRSGFHRAFFGEKEILIPVYRSLDEACEKNPEADVLINYASERSAFEVSQEALDIKSLRTIYMMAEGIPENKIRTLIKLNSELGENEKFLIGPSTVGVISAGSFRTANAGGSIENLIESKLYRPGSVGIVTISGGMLAEMLNIVGRKTDGAYEAIAIGGDKFPGSTLAENLICLNDYSEIKMLVCLGELGGNAEYDIIEAIKSGKITKPLVMWVTGTIAVHMKAEIQFGHANAKSGAEKESAQAKNEALREVGVYVPNSFDDFGDLIEKVYLNLNKKMTNNQEPIIENYNEIPENRKSASIVSTISDDRGEEPTYNKIPISDYADKSIGHVINALWFKGELPEIGEKFIEICIKLTADHGPAVATAHNSIVTSRSGNNVVMSLIAGLTTIGDRHGGAIDGTAQWLLNAVENEKSAREIVDQHKHAGKYVMGIGHRIKTALNPDKRVEIMKKFAKDNKLSNKFLNKALEVESETLKKKNNLILNVDGCIGAIFLDILDEAGFDTKEMKSIIESGALNAIFVLARSIGMIGHALDQKRMNEPMYRHNWDDILYS